MSETAVKSVPSIGRAVLVSCPAWGEGRCVPPQALCLDASAALSLWLHGQPVGRTVAVRFELYTLSCRLLNLTFIPPPLPILFQTAVLWMKRFQTHIFSQRVVSFVGVCL